MRRLAQSSASAAQEVRKLIEASNAEVDKGTQTVEGAARVMDEVVDASGRVNQIMESVVSMSLKQSRHLQELTRELTQ